MYISTVEMYYSYLAAATYRMRCIFQLVRCIFLSGGGHLQNEMYILSEKMYISTGELYLKYTSLQLKYTSHSLSGGRQIRIIHLTS